MAHGDSRDCAGKVAGARRGVEASLASTLLKTTVNLSLIIGNALAIWSCAKPGSRSS